MSRALALARRCALALARLRPAAALRRRIGRPGGADAARRSQVAPIPGQAGWLVRNALDDRLGGDAGGAAALPARGRARRQYHRLRHPRRQRDDARAADPARALPAGRRCDAARWCSTPPPAPTPASTSSAREYATVAAEQTALERLSESVADQIVARLGLVRARATAAGAVKAAKGSIDAALDRPDRRLRFYLLHGPDDAQIARAWRAAAGTALGAAERFDRRGGRAQGAIRRVLADEAGAMCLFGGRARSGSSRPATRSSPAVEALLEAPAVGKPGGR